MSALAGSGPIRSKLGFDYCKALHGATDNPEIKWRLTSCCG